MQLAQLWQPNKDKSNQTRFRAMMESGQLVDEVADIVQTQVIAPKARASIRNRDAVPLYHHTEEGRPPVWKENLLVETGMSPPPGMDSRYVLEDSLNLWKGIKTGAVEPPGLESALKRGSMAIALNVAAVIVFVVCGWVVSTSTSPAPEAPTVNEEVVGREVIRENPQDGFVDIEDLVGGPSPEGGGIAPEVEGDSSPAP